MIFFVIEIEIVNSQLDKFKKINEKHIVIPDRNNLMTEI